MELCQKFIEIDKNLLFVLLFELQGQFSNECCEVIAKLHVATILSSL